MGVSYEFVRGDSDGINGKQLKDGQLLFDTEKRRISIDTTINGSLSRVNMSSSADNFVGTTAEWNALTSTEKAQYKTVDITDDYEGAIAIDSALSSTSTNPVQNKVITGELSKTYSESDATESNIADDDYIPFYDISSSAKKKSPLSNIISKIQAASISVQDVLTSTDSTKPLSANMGNALGKMIAPIESSFTASRTYTIGEQFVYNGITYKAISVISLGDTINPGGNCTPASSVTSQMEVITNQVNDMNNVLGAKNLLPNNEVTQVNSGIFFIVNDDGSVRLTGTATANVFISLPIDLTDGVTYTASGISGGSANTYQVTLRTESGELTSNGELYNGEVTFTKNSGQASPNNYDVHIYGIRVNSGATVDTTIYPMIRLASIMDDTYVPYAKTNQELTKNVDINASDIVKAQKTVAYINTNSTTASKAYAQGEQFILNGVLKKAKTAISSGATLTLNSNYENASSVTSQIRNLTNEVDYNAEKFYDNAGAHNCIYRGKYLGNSVTAEQYAAISAGTFEDLYIGDYWTINNVNYRIGHFNYWLGTGSGDGGGCTTNHVLIVPDSLSIRSKMNDSSTTTGGYVGSDFKTGNNDNTALQSAKTKIITAFGSDHILTHMEYFTNAVDGQTASNGAWYSSDVDLMSENMVYGTNIFTRHDYQQGSKTMDVAQIKLFAERSDLITRRNADWWLRDVADAMSFAFVDGWGGAYKAISSNSCYIRPAFAIKA